MTSPLAGGIAKTIGKAFKSPFYDAVLTRDTASSNSPDIDSFDPLAPTSTDYDCKAIVETYSLQFRKDGLVDVNDRKVLILATTLSVTPVAGDRVTIRGIVFTVMEVTTDPAIAIWECKGRM